MRKGEPPFAAWAISYAYHNRGIFARHYLLFYGAASSHWDNFALVFMMKAVSAVKVAGLKAFYIKIDGKGKQLLEAFGICIGEASMKIVYRFLRDD